MRCCWCGTSARKIRRWLTPLTLNKKKRAMPIPIENASFTSNDLLFLILCFGRETLRRTRCTQGQENAIDKRGETHGGERTIPASLSLCVWETETRQLQLLLRQQDHSLHH